MNRSMKTLPMKMLSGAVVLSLLPVLGCTPPGGKDGTADPERGNMEIKPPPTPPEPPARRDVKRDDSLRASAVAEIEKALRSNDPYIRANAIEGIQRSLGPAGADRIAEGLRDPSAVVRFASVMASGTLRLDDQKPLVRGLLEDPSAKVQVAVRYALHRMGDTTHSHDLEKFARSPDASVRRTTVMVLGMLENPSAMKILRALENDPDGTVRLQVVDSEYRLGDERAKESLAAAVVSRYADDQIFALLAFGSRPGTGVQPLLRGKLTSDYEEVSLTAARALGMLGSDMGMGVALKGADAKDEFAETPDGKTKVNVGAQRRALAALALGEIGRYDAQPQLAKLLRDKAPTVRVAAATAILQLKQ